MAIKAANRYIIGHHQSILSLQFGLCSRIFTPLMQANKAIFACLALGIYCLALVAPFAPMIEYAINKDYIAANLCVNIEVDSSCQGKCYLADQMAKQFSKSNGEQHNSDDVVQFDWAPHTVAKGEHVVNLNLQQAPIQLMVEQQQMVLADLEGPPPKA